MMTYKFVFVCLFACLWCVCVCVFVCVIAILRKKTKKTNKNKTEKVYRNMPPIAGIKAWLETETYDMNEMESLGFYDIKIDTKICVQTAGVKVYRSIVTAKVNSTTAIHWSMEKKDYYSLSKMVCTKLYQAILRYNGSYKNQSHYPEIKSDTIEVIIIKYQTNHKYLHGYFNHFLYPNAHFLKLGILNFCLL